MEFAKTLCDPSSTPQQLSQGLTDLQKSLIMVNFKGKDEAALMETFKSIWKGLLITSANPASSVRLASYKATGIYLTKITPYFPNEICKSFSEIALEATITAHNSAIIASSFAYITRFIAPMYLQQFLKSTPVFHHFSFIDPTFSEYIAQIITNSRHLGIDWLKILLHSLLERIDAAENRHLSKAVAAIVNLHPTTMFEELIDFIIENNKPMERSQVILSHLPLLAYILNNIEGKSSKFDLYEISEAAITLLNKSEKSIVESDSAFQLLAIENRSFSVNITLINENIEISLQNADKTKNNKANICIEKFKESPAFYLMPLPFEMLIPNENDSPSVRNSKNTSLGRLANHIEDQKKLDEIVEILIKSASQQNLEAAISVNTAISICINNLLKHASIDVLSKLLLNIIFIEKSSWYRSLSMLKIIGNINFKLFISRIGRPIYNDILELLCKLCFEKNESLYVTACDILAKVISRQDVSFVCNVLISDSSFFNEYKLERALIAFNKILQKFGEAIPEIAAYSDAVTECSSFFEDDTNVLSPIFEFLALCKSSSNERLRDIAINIAKSYISIISGEKWGNNTSYQSQIEYIVSMKSMDVVAQPIDDILKYLDPFRSTIHFILNLSKSLLPNDFIIELCTRVFPIFPREITKFFDDFLPELSESEKLQFISGVYNRLQFVSDINILTTWCNIVLKNDAVFFEENQVETLSFFNGLTLFYRNTNIQMTSSQALSFLLLRCRMSDDPMEDFCKFLQNVKNTQKSMFISAFNDEMPGIVEAVKQKKPELLEINAKENVEKIEIEKSDFNFDKSDRNDLKSRFITTIHKKEMIHLLVTILESKKSNEKLCLDSVTIPKSFVGNLTDLVKNYENVEMSVPYCLKLMRTRFGDLALSKVQNNVNDVIQIYKNKEILKKGDTLNLSSIVSNLPVDVELVSQWCLQVMKDENMTKNRLNSAYILLYSVCYLYRTIPQKVTDDLYSIFEGYETPNKELSYLLCTICNRSKIDAKYINLIRKFSQNCGYKTSIQSTLFLPLISTKDSKQTFIDEITNMIKMYVVSVMPSLLLSALKLYQHCANVYDNDTFLYISKPIFEHIRNRYKMVQMNPPLVEYSTNCLKASCVKGIPVYKAIPLLIIDETKPAFSNFCDLIPFLIKYSSVLDDSNILEISQKLLARDDFLLNKGLRCLCSQIDKFNDNETKNSILLDNLLEQIKQIEHDRTSNWYECWVNTLEEYLKPTNACSIIVFQLLKNNFARCFVALSKFVHRNRNKEICEVVLSGQEICQTNSQKKALELLANGANIKVAITLSLFADDCEESEAIIKSL
ncbi:hypothetical protein TVAG_474870 [Trichomonas vaginalis G3]|uniref:Uncharacterized protein n=1 Tax=Trichomonas vaginalis (strain ATCC PRA-98 / G3) TaxID=412133 RepID=A2ERN7_TRIV3|nr:armadillo (ARM) repeat-containing protein family [Trichomonas vaginalis G3]EAY04689.1 hypothetical protein TVAG_474870 [Trichomonas vaginalis G3]KAI5530901.1 armadillo (ARM) repeat-containing protein family [Trichomonas vaginalis G3]|eukprot:XP_001316912.1 hypothetical protein [Trichomonas vaginalis G3]